MPSNNQLPDLPSFDLGGARLILADEESPDFEKEAKKPTAPPPPPVSLFDALKATCAGTPAVPPTGFQSAKALGNLNDKRFIPSEEGPLMGDVGASEPSLGQRMLQELNNAVLSNSMDATTAREMAVMVENWQTRLDLIGIGMTAYGMSRVQSVTQMAEDVERHIWERLADLPVTEAIGLLKVLHKDRLAFINLVGNRASNPTISSPDALSGGLNGRAEESSKPKVSMIKPDGRKRLHLMIGKLRKVIDADATVVESPT